MQTTKEGVKVSRRKLIKKVKNDRSKHHQKASLEELGRKSTTELSDVGSSMTTAEQSIGMASIPYSHLFFSDSISKEAQFKHLLDCFMGIKHIQRMQPLTQEQLTLHRLELPTPNQGQKTLFLDLDETLIHTSIDPSVQFQHQIMINIDGQMKKISFRLRPYCLEFLKAVSLHYEVYIFTASNEEYAQAAMEFLNTNSKTITGYLSRQSCLKTSLGIYIKDIMRVSNRQPKQMLLVDNLAYSFGHMIDNGIPVVEFTGNQSDRELLHLEKYLIECAKQQDVMKFNRDQLRLRDIVEQLGSYFEMTLAY